MKKKFIKFAFILILGSCSNSTDFETGEIKTLQLLKNAIKETNSPKIFIDARKILSREQIDAAQIPVLYVELKSGQNGTLTPYPGKGLGKTWLGADGATITLDRGILKASRGMGNDIMGSTSKMPDWSKIDNNQYNYNRKISYITGSNKIMTIDLKCDIQKSEKKELLEIWNIEFLVTKFKENCDHNGFGIKNTYYIDDRGIIRKSLQYHSDTIGYITIARLDR